MADEKQTIRKPLPELTPVNQPFWDAAKAGKLMMQKCEDCGTWISVHGRFAANVQARNSSGCRSAAEVQSFPSRSSGKSSGRRFAVSLPTFLT